MTARPYYWQDFALCAETDPAIFFPGAGETIAPAIAICHQCSVRAECLADSLATEREPDGIRGGLAANARKRLLRKLKGLAA